MDFNQDDPDELRKATIEQVMQKLTEATRLMGIDITQPKVLTADRRELIDAEVEEYMLWTSYEGSELAKNIANIVIERLISYGLLKIS